MGQSPRQLDPSRSVQDFFGAELRRRRTTQGLSQAELGRLTHHSGDAIAKVEKALRTPTEVLARRCDDALQAEGALIRLWSLVAAQAPTVKGEPPNRSADLISSTAEESAADATLFSSQVEVEAVDELHQQVVSLARGYSGHAAMEGFLVARHTRDAARRLRDRTQRTCQLSDLQLVLSCANALMSSFAFDLGRLDAASTLARAAAMHAQAAGHASAHAWAEGMLALIANWHGDPERALLHTDRGLERLAPGVARLKILYIAARAHGLQRNRIAVAATLDRAKADREAADGQFDDLHDGIGGEFGFGHQRALACAAAAWLDAGDTRRATVHAEAALTGHQRSADTDEPTSQLRGVTIDLAAARLLDGDAREAAEYVHAALAVTPNEIGTALSGRLDRVRGILNDSRWHADPVALALADVLHP